MKFKDFAFEMAAILENGGVCKLPWVSCSSDRFENGLIELLDLENPHFDTKLCSLVL